MVYQGPSRGCNSCRQRRKKVRSSSNSYRPLLNSVKTFLLSSVTRRVQYVEIFIQKQKQTNKTTKQKKNPCPQTNQRTRNQQRRQRLIRRAPVVLEVYQ